MQAKRNQVFTQFDFVMLFILSLKI